MSDESLLVEERLSYETPQFLHSLFADDVSLLANVDKELDVKTTTRDGWVMFRGEPKAVSSAKQLFVDLESVRRGGGGITERDFQTALEAVKTGVGMGLKEISSIRLTVSKGRKVVVPRTVKQVEYVQQMHENDVTFGLGPAGTGKTYLAMAMALSMLKAREVNRVILTRPAVEAGEALGFLPGDLREKVAPYLRPLYDALHDMLEPEESNRYMNDGTIEIAPLAYMRGRTLSRAFVILDEAQNTTREQMFMFLTRIGESSRCVVTGDGSQTDLKPGVSSGLLEAEKALQNVESVAFSRLTKVDVVRHKVVARIIEAYDDYRVLHSK